MGRSKFIKALTLFSFISFIIAFLLYRTGSFDSYITVVDPSLQTSPNGGAIKTAKPDSLVTLPEMDSIQKLRMFSSKSMVLVDEKTPLFLPTKPKRKPVYTAPPVRMSSSKSGIIFPPSRIKLTIDSIKFDLEKIKRIKN